MTVMTVMQNSFFERRTLSVAKDLLGKIVMRKFGRQKIGIIITETEAYIGETDLASHARFGRTKRNEVMYGKAGNWYPYLIYGMYWCLNVITEKEGKPAAVLLRAGKLVQGEDYLKSLGVSLNCNGPGRLARVLGVDKSFYAKSAIKGELYLTDGIPISSKQIKRMPRVGIDYAGDWKDKPWRFVATLNG